MKLTNEFTIDAPVDEIWTTMLDLERVAACVPGSKVVGPAPDGGLEANIRVKVGPMAMNYRGVVRIVESDERSRRAVMQAKAREARGQGTATADMVMEIRDTQPVEVSIATDLDVTGRVAQMGRGVMQDVAGRIVQDFAKGLQALLAAGDGLDASCVIAADSAGTEDPSRVAPAATSAQTALPRPSALSPAGDVSAAAVDPSASIGAGALAIAVVRGRFRALIAWVERQLGARR